jgi:formylglycine-generating enzyme required for sulfatase activity
MVYPEIDKIGPDLIVPPEKFLLKGYRLPLAAEWEYAARGGAGTRWCFGEDPGHLPEYAWYLFSSGEHTWPVGTRRPNSYGLFHVHGNLKEWCHDTVDLETTDEILVGNSGQDVVHGNKEARGGYYRSMTRLTRSAKRFSYEADTKISVMGFRVARTMPVE